MSFSESFNKHLWQNNLIQPGETVLAAVSGGPDSLALLDLLDQFRRIVPFTLLCAHYNHGLRKEADREENEVREFCLARGIPFFTEKGRVNEKAAGRGLEETAREMRYAFLVRTAKEERAGKIALGHHADDQAETVLFHMIRGAGLEGLMGMKTITTRDGVDLIRPLLPFSKKEILDYVSHRGLKYAVDASNEETVFSRNKIRHQVMPALEEVVSDPSGAINRCAQNVREEKRLLDSLLAPYIEKLIQKREGDVCLDPELFDSDNPVYAEDAFRIRIIRESAKAAGMKKDFSRKHAYDLLALFAGTSSGKIDLPNGFEAVKMQKTRLIRRKEDKQKVQDGLFNPISIFDKRANDLLKKNHVFMAVFENKKDADAFSATLKNPCRYTYLYDTMKKNISIRKRLPGDYVVLKDGKRKKLKRFFIDQKIPSEQRDKLPLLALDSEILWIPGLFSRKFDIPRNMHAEIHIAAEGTIK